MLYSGFLAYPRVCFSPPFLLQHCPHTSTASAHTTPGAGSAALPTPQKRLSAISMSLAGKGPPGGDPANQDVSVPPSPLKPEFTMEPPLHAQRMQAVRRITFEDQQPGVADGLETAVEAKEESLVARRVGLTKVPSMRRHILHYRWNQQFAFGREKKFLCWFLYQAKLWSSRTPDLIDFLSVMHFCIFVQ